MRRRAFSLFLFPFFFICYEFSGNLSTDMYLPALLEISQEMGKSFDVLQETITSWLLGLALSQLFLAPFTDYYGRRAVLLVGGGFFLLATLACSLATSFWILFFARMLQGFSVGSIMISGYASIHSLYPDRKATLILSWTSTAAIASPMLGPLIGSWILLVGSWREIFFLIFLWALIALFFLFFIMPESLSPSKRHPFRFRKICDSYCKTLLCRGFFLRCLAFAFQDGGMVLWISASPKIIMTHFGYSPQKFGYLQAFVFIGFVLGARSIGFLLKVMKRAYIVYVGMAFSLVGAIFLLSFSLFREIEVVELLVFVGIYALGVGLSSAPLVKESFIASPSREGFTTSVYFLIATTVGAFISFVIAILPDTVLEVSSLLCIGIFLSFFLYLFRDTPFLKKG